MYIYDNDYENKLPATYNGVIENDYNISDYIYDDNELGWSCESQKREARSYGERGDKIGYAKRLCTVQPLCKDDFNKAFWDAYNEYEKKKKSGKQNMFDNPTKRWQKRCNQGAIKIAKNSPDIRAPLLQVDAKNKYGVKVKSQKVYFNNTSAPLVFEFKEDMTSFWGKNEAGRFLAVRSKNDEKMLETSEELQSTLAEQRVFAYQLWRICSEDANYYYVVAETNTRYPHTAFPIIYMTAINLKEINGGRIEENKFVEQAFADGTKKYKYYLGSSQWVLQELLSWDITKDIRIVLGFKSGASKWTKRILITALVVAVVVALIIATDGAILSYVPAILGALPNIPVSPSGTSPPNNNENPPENRDGGNNGNNGNNKGIFAGMGALPIVLLGGLAVTLLLSQNKNKPIAYGGTR